MNRGGVNAAAKIALALLAILGEALNFPLSAAAQQDLDYTGNSTATQPEVVALSGRVTACPVGQRMGPDSPAATPRLFSSGTDTQLTVTSVVPADPSLIPGSVMLLQVDSSGNQTAVLGQMYDDGTHGDATAGDGMYTAQPTVNIPTAGRIYLAVQAKYSGPPGCRQSDNNEGTILVSGPLPSLADADFAAKAEVKIWKYFQTQVAENGYDAARTSTVRFALQQRGVADAGISSDGTTIWIEYTTGYEELINSRPPGYR